MSFFEGHIKKYLFILFILSSSFIRAQTPTELIKIGDICIEKKDNYGALLYYKQAFEADSGAAEYSYKYAEALRLTNNYNKSCYYYQKTYKKDKGKFFPLGIYYIALMQKYGGDYEESKKNWKKVKNQFVGNKTSYYYLKAIKEIEACETAKRVIADTLAVQITNIGAPVNSMESEFGGFEVNDTTLYFNSLKDESSSSNNVTNGTYKIKIYDAKKIADKWSDINPLDKLVIKDNLDVANGSFNKNKTLFVYSACEDYNLCKLFKADIINGNFENIKELNNQINIKGKTQTQPCFGDINGSEVLFFSTNKNADNADIYYAFANPNGEFSDPIDAGKNINTLGNEITPYYNSKTNELFFSSDWQSGLGGYDIFKSKIEKNNFSIPENMGVPYNSSLNDLYYNENENHNRGYLTSNRENGIKNEVSTCCNDIYFFNINVPTPSDSQPSIKSFEEVMKYLPIKLFFHNDEPNPKSNAIKTYLDYESTFKEYSKRKYEYLFNYNLEQNDSIKIIAQNKINYFFDAELSLGMEQLRLVSELLIKELGDGKNIDLTLKGFASPLANSDYNVNLTKRRICSVTNYIKTYNNNILLKYLNGTAANKANLNIIEIPFGEYKSSNEVSDDLGDLKNAVYSLNAINERKIEIVSIKYALEDSLFSNLKIDHEIFNFGLVKKGIILKQKFEITNTGNTTLSIKDIVSDYECLNIDFTESTLKPNEKVIVEVNLDTKSLDKKNIFVIDIETENAMISKEINLTVEVN